MSNNLQANNHQPQSEQTVDVQAEHREADELPNRPLGWGLIGASHIAREHMTAAINSQPQSHVAAVYSTSMERGRAFADELAIPNAYDALDDLLEDPAVDCVYISTTNDRHFDEVQQAALAGKHVLCEKPFALTLQQALEMVAACNRASVVLGANQQLRASPLLLKMRDLIANNAVGTPLAARVFHAIYLPERLQTWRLNRPEAGGGVILDLTVHDVDVLRFLLDEEVDEVTAIALNQGMASGSLEDAAMGTMRFRSGLLAQFHDAFTIRYAGTGLEIHGSEGSLIARDVMGHEGGGSVELHNASGSETLQMPPPENLYERTIMLFNDAVRNGSEPAARAEDGVRSLAVALAARESSKTGELVRVRYDLPTIERSFI